jgi:hypothetical protein
MEVGKMADEQVKADEAGVQQAGEPPVAQGGKQPESWEAWLQEQPEETRTLVASLYEAQTQGLRSALRAEREQRGGLEKQLREIGKQLEEGSAARTQLEAMATDYESAQQRVAFYESAPSDLVNPKLAWLAAQELDAFDRRGNVAWDALRKQFPELFKQKVTSANAGSGAQGSPKPFDMNDALRDAAGRNRL